MIFDTPEMQKLRNKFKHVPDFDAPEIVLLDKSQHLIGEHEYLEKIIQSVPEYTQKKWKNNLLSEDIENHMGTWFEMMLFGWLQDQDGFAVQPEIEDGSPDIMLDIGNERIFVEAKTILTEEADREKNRRIAAVFSILKTIALPFGLSKEILHKSISGTLVFKAKNDDNLNRRVLDARYIQNPFAKIWVDPFLFPVKSSYTVFKFAMGWRTNHKIRGNL